MATVGFKRRPFHFFLEKKQLIGLIALFLMLISALICSGLAIGKLTKKVLVLQDKFDHLSLDMHLMQREKSKDYKSALKERSEIAQEQYKFMRKAERMEEALFKHVDLVKNELKEDLQALKKQQKEYQDLRSFTEGLQSNNINELKKEVERLSRENHELKALIQDLIHSKNETDKQFELVFNQTDLKIAKSQAETEGLFNKINSMKDQIIHFVSEFQNTGKNNSAMNTETHDLIKNHSTALKSVQEELNVIKESSEFIVKLDHLKALEAYYDEKIGKLSQNLGKYKTEMESILDKTFGYVNQGKNKVKDYLTSFKWKGSNDTPMKLLEKIGLFDLRETDSDDL